MSEERKPFVAVVGGVNIDLCGKPFAPLIRRDSNPGRVTISLGGVGRNIAHNMTLLGLDVTLITALGTDVNAGTIETSCEELGIDLTHAIWVPGAATSTYLVLTDHQGEMELAVSDMDIYRHLTPDYIEGTLDVLDGADAVVVDTNLPAETLAFLAQRCAAPIFADSVSTAKAEKLRPILGRLHTLKANALEAAALSGVAVTDEVSLQLAANALLDTGLRRVLLSLGADGLLAAERGKMLRLPIFPGEMKNATGCGDALMAALVWAHCQDLPLEEAGKAGLAAAAIALAGAETINPALSAAAVRRLAGL